MKDFNIIEKLYRKYLRSEAAPEEILLLMTYFKACGEDQLRNLIKGFLEQREDEALHSEWDTTVERVYGQIQEMIKQEDGKRKNISFFSRIFHSLLRQKVAAMAAAFAIASTVAFYFLKNQSEVEKFPKEIVASEVLPGRNQAIMKIKGQDIVLSDDHSGIVINENGISYTDGTSLLLTGAAKQTKIEWYEVSTPKGGHYQITLPDGSNVWLNSASKLIYPSHFTANKREVELLGEAYFSVNKVASGDQFVISSPFVVKTMHQTVQVMGTEFNITSYDRAEGIRTTLINGSIRVDNQQYDTKILRPGQESVVFPNHQIEVRHADIGLATAWKQGVFRFKNTPLVDVLAQLGRWYNIDVENTLLPNNRLYGKIDRDVPLSKVLGMIEKTSNLKFELKERRLTLRP